MRSLVRSSSDLSMMVSGDKRDLLRLSTGWNVDTVSVRTVSQHPPAAGIVIVDCRFGSAVLHRCPIAQVRIRVIDEAIMGGFIRFIARAAHQQCCADLSRILDKNPSYRRGRLWGTVRCPIFISKGIGCGVWTLKGMNQTTWEAQWNRTWAMAKAKG